MTQELLTDFLMWCTILSVGLLIFWSLLFLTIPDWIYGIHTKWFPMPRETWNVAVYCFVGLFKILFVMFFLIPYVALLLV